MWVALCLLVAWAVRVMVVMRRSRAFQPAGTSPVRTLAVLGSGGHTAEMIQLLRSLDRSTFAPMLYVIANSDHTSARRIEAFEGDGTRQYRLLRLPRSREVGQSYLSSTLTTLYAMLHAFVLVWRTLPSLVLCNGPGTCIPVCVAAFAVRLCREPSHLQSCPSLMRMPFSVCSFWLLAAHAAHSAHPTPLCAAAIARGEAREHRVCGVDLPRRIDLVER